MPASELDEDIVKTVDLWDGSLRKYGLAVSTGPVVPFRARAFLTDVDAVKAGRAVPLLWMQNVQTQRVEWPVTKDSKPQGILYEAADKKLLVPLHNYVLLRRFSAKEDRRRLMAAPLIADRLDPDYQQIGLENHLNYIYHQQGSLTVEEATGLAALFNSALMDRYFRILNGHTQVNAAELWALSLPPVKVIRRIGQEVTACGEWIDLDTIVFSMLRESGYLSPDFPIVRETRVTMNKIQEAQEVLRALGLPRAQQNEISALTLLVLAQLSEDTPWSEARRKSLRIHDILVEINERYGREYAENTWETVRRQVIHQFQHAGLALRNPDDPSLPTNSPRTHYALFELAVKTLGFS